MNRSKSKKNCLKMEGGKIKREKVCWTKRAKAEQKIGDAHAFFFSLATLPASPTTTNFTKILIRKENLMAGLNVLGLVTLVLFVGVTAALTTTASVNIGNANGGLSINNFDPRPASDTPVPHFLFHSCAKAINSGQRRFVLFWRWLSLCCIGLGSTERFHAFFVCVRKCSTHFSLSSALNYLGYLSQAKSISSVSGGTWGTVPFTYLPSSISDRFFFGASRLTLFFAQRFLGHLRQ